MTAEPMLWAYGVTAARAVDATTLPPGVAGGTVAAIRDGELELLASPVPRDDFAEAPLREHLNDLAWLERTARAHEAVLEAALARTTVVPLRLCTIFDGDAGARAMLAGRAAELRAALAALDGRQEWSVKLLVDRDALGGGTAAGDTGAAAGPGAAYFQRRRDERAQREAAAAVAARLAEDVHARLRDWAGDAVLRPAQNRELSGHQGEMVLNGAYLVETARTADLHALVADLRERHAASGARIELSGPFPAYNFAGQAGG